ncbi:MAG: SPFH domain-containing protein [Deefgea sp.]
MVPQQSALVIERLGRFHAVLAPGLSIVIPFIDRVAYRHSLKEIPLDIPSQVCITRDNTQLQVDGILYFQVIDPRMASYGSSDYVMAISQLAQTTLRSVVGKLEMDKTFEERDEINRSIVAALDEAAASWGVKVLRYEIKDLTPPQAILHSMQQQITAEREKRALIAQSEGVKQQQINLATGQREAAIQQSQGEMQANINESEGERQAQINRATGEAEALRLVAHATAEAVQAVAAAIQTPGGMEAVNLKVAEQYVAAFGNIAKTGNTMLLPSNAADVAGMVATAMNVVKSANLQKTN